MIARRIAWLPLVLSLLALTSSSRPENGALKVTLIDTKTEAVLAYSNVALRTAHRVGITNEKGVVIFDDLPPGRYELKSMPVGYVSKNSRVRVKAGKEKVVTVRLKQRPGMKPYVFPDSVKTPHSTFE